MTDAQTADRPAPLPTSRTQLLTMLSDDLGLICPTQAHAPLFTVEDSIAVRASLPVGSPGGPVDPAVPAGHCKNLFLKNKKGEMWLCSMLEDRSVDLKALGLSLGLSGSAQRLSFASPQRLFEHLGVRPGAVTPFAALNDRDAAVTVLLDAGFRALRWLHFHPLVNDHTTMISPDDLVTFLKSTGHEPRFVEF